MNKQEALKKIEKLDGLTIKDKDFNFDIEMIPKGEALEIVNQLDEPEKPVVPQFVADWIEWCKNNNVTLLGAMSPIDELGTAICDDKKVESLESSKWATRNQETFAKAWLFGYGVEKEKLYRVELPNPNGDSNMYGLCKVDGRIIIGTFVFGLNKASNAKLTEAEIKQDFEWTWQFAEEVK